MATLSELRAKYRMEGGNYEPNPSCKHCKGNGERMTRDGRETFCICLFVDHSASDEIGTSIGAFAKRQLTDMAVQPKGDAE